MNARRTIRLAKEGSWVVAGTLAYVAGALALVRVLTEHLGPDEYGRLALALTVAGLVGQCLTGGVSNGIARFFSVAAEEGDLVGYLHASRRLMRHASTLVALFAVVLAAALYWLGYAHWIGLALAALAFSILSGYTGSLDGIQNAARQRDVVALHVGLDALTRILLALAMIAWIGPTGTAVMSGYALATLVVIGSQLMFLRRLIPAQALDAPVSTGWAARIWAYSWPFSAWGVFTWAQQASDRWALQAFASTHEVGLYAVLYQLGFVPIGIVVGMVVTMMEPILYRRSGNAADASRNESVHRIVWLVTIAGLLATVLGFALTRWLHDWIFGLLVADAYRSVSKYLPWVVLSGGVFASGQILSLKLMSEMKTATMTTAKITTAVLGAACNVLGARAFGLEGVIGALVAFAASYFVWLAFLARRPAGSSTPVPASSPDNG